MDYIVVIPARYGSSRLPGKPLLEIAGQPMIRHVWEQARCSGAKQVVIATDDARIEAAAQAFGATVVMTSAQHPSGTDRLEEVARKLGLADDAVVVNVQGDEPMIPSAIIDQVAQLIARHPEASIATLCERIGDIDTVFNPNVVKVVMDALGRALYFSRAPIPWMRDEFAAAGGRPSELPANASYFRHIGIYAYRVKVLRQFVQWPPATLEQLECLEQLRAMANGAVIAVEEACEVPPAGVDTAEDLERVRTLMAARA